MRTFRQKEATFPSQEKGTLTVSYGFFIDSGEVKLLYDDVCIGDMALKSVKDNGTTDGRLVINHFYNHSIPGELNYKDVLGEGKKGKGVGKILMWYLIEMCEKMGDTIIYVDEPTDHGTGAYLYFGFAKTGDGMKMSVSVASLKAKVMDPKFQIVDVPFAK